MAERCAVVTGVSKGLGEAIAANLLARGFDVVGLGRDASARLSHAAFRLVHADFADVGALPAIVDPLFDALASKRYASMALVNNAAVAGPAGTVGRIDANALVESLAVNLAAPMILANAFVRAFALESGDRRIVNVSSGAAVQPIPGAGVYNVAKAGLEMIAAVVTSEQPASGVRAITVRPGIIDTPMQAWMRARRADELPSVAMFQAFHQGRQLVPPDVTAAKIVDRLLLGRVDAGRIYSYEQL